MNSKSSYLLPFLLLCNSRNRSHKLWIGRVVIFAFCCTFCLLDIIHNVLFFLQRPFTVNIHLDYDQPIALPSLTICIPNIVDLPQLRQQYPAVYEKYVNISWDKYYWRPRFAAEFTIGQLRQMQPKQEQILVNCTLLSSRLTPMPCTQITPVQRFFSMGKYCYTYFEQHPQLLNNISNQSNVSAIDISNSSASSKTTKKSATDAGNKLGESNLVYSNRAIRNREWIRLTIDRSQLWNQWLDVLITHKGRQFEMFNGQPCFLTVSTEITNHFEFTFEQTYVQRLPAPFESNCVHYVDQYDCLNRAHCVDTCLANRTLHAKHFWPFQLETIDAGFDLSNVKFEPDDAYNAFRSECSQRYTQPDCKSTQHIAYLNRIEMCEPTDPKLESQEQFTFDTDDMEMEGNASVYMYDGLAWMDEPMTTWLADANETATDEPLNELDMINGDRETNDEENNSNDAEMTEPMAVIENTPINTDCGSRHVTISVKFSSEFTTRMVYVPIFDSMQLIGNVGQAVSVYLGLCLYDIHRLMSAYVGCMRRRRHRPRPVRSAAVRTLRFDS